MHIVKLSLNTGFQIYMEFIFLGFLLKLLSLKLGSTNICIIITIQISISRLMWM